MALVKYSALIERLSGKVGAAIFQENQGGSILRQFCPPVNRNTPRQTKAKLIASTAQQGWAVLTPQERDNWEGYARFMRIHQRRNTNLFISGHQAYLRVNQIRLNYSLALLNDPEFNNCDALPVDAELRLAGPNLFIDFDRNMIAMQEFVVLFITIPLPITWNNPRVHLKLLEFVTTNAPTKNITSEYFDLYKFGLVAGDTVFFKYTSIDLFSGYQFPFQTKKQTLT
ncbi:MAG: hypothetical protein V3T76_09730 [candidate division NC10 bacterium]